jgi:hypothetical protein
VGRGFLSGGFCPKEGRGFLSGGFCPKEGREGYWHVPIINIEKDLHI